MIPLQNASLTFPGAEASLITLLVKPINWRHFPAQASHRISKSKSFTPAKHTKPLPPHHIPLSDNTGGDDCKAGPGRAGPAPRPALPTQQRLPLGGSMAPQRSGERLAQHPNHLRGHHGFSSCPDGRRGSPRARRPPAVPEAGGRARCCPGEPLPAAAAPRMRAAQRCGRLRVGGERRVQSAGGVCARGGGAGWGGRGSGGRVMLLGVTWPLAPQSGRSLCGRSSRAPGEREEEEEGGRGAALRPTGPRVRGPARRSGGRRWGEPSRAELYSPNRPLRAAGARVPPARPVPVGLKGFGGGRTVRGGRGQYHSGGAGGRDWGAFMGAVLASRPPSPPLSPSSPPVVACPAAAGAGAVGPRARVAGAVRSGESRGESQAGAGPLLGAILEGIFPPFPRGRAQRRRGAGQSVRRYSAPRPRRFRGCPCAPVTQAWLSRAAVPGPVRKGQLSPAGSAAVNPLCLGESCNWRVPCLLPSVGAGGRFILGRKQRDPNPVCLVLYGEILGMLWGMLEM